MKDYVAVEAAKYGREQRDYNKSGLWERTLSRP